MVLKISNIYFLIQAFLPGDEIELDRKSKPFSRMWNYLRVQW